MPVRRAVIARHLRHHASTRTVRIHEPFSFDPASLLILDRLNQVLSRLDQIPAALAGVNHEPPVLPVEVHHAPAQEDSLSQEDGAYDQLRIPPARTNPDAVLRWPIFENRYPPNYITDAVFVADSIDGDTDCEESSITQSGNLRRAYHAKPKFGGIDEDAILELVQKFLDLVHIKNPILEIDALWSYARHVAEEGLASCLVVSPESSVEFKISSRRFACILLFVTGDSFLSAPSARLRSLSR